MSKIGLFDQTVALLSKTLDLRMQNQEAIASNIANVETPGYNAVHLEFEKGLKQALSEAQNAAANPSGGDAPFARVQARVVRTNDGAAIGDKNGVNLDKEMTSLAENQLLYDAATQMVSKKLGMLRYVVQETK